MKYIKRIIIDGYSSLLPSKNHTNYPTSCLGLVVSANDRRLVTVFLGQITATASG